MEKEEDGGGSRRSSRNQQQYQQGRKEGQEDDQQHQQDVKEEECTSPSAPRLGSVGWSCCALLCPAVPDAVPKLSLRAAASIGAAFRRHAQICDAHSIRRADGLLYW